MELDQVIARLFHQGKQKSEVKVSRSSRDISHHYAARPIINRRIGNVHEIALQPLSNDLGHTFRRCEVSRHVSNDRNVRHWRIHCCRNDHAHKHIVVSHNPAESFTVAHHSDFRGAVKWIHRLATQARGRGDDSDLSGSTGLHAREKWENRIEYTVYVRRKDVCCHLLLRNTTNTTVAISSVLPQSGIITAAFAITKSILK